MVGCPFNYFAKQARQRCDESKDRVAHNTATGYCSSIKSHFENKFRKQVHGIPIFKAECWKKLRVHLLSSYEEQIRQTGESLVNPHEASSKEDREAIATGCIWLGTPEAAEFHHLNVTMAQYVGRGSEVSLDCRSRLTTTHVNELHCSYDVLQTKLKRQKFGKESDIAICPHSTSFFQDYHFSLLHRIVMLGDDTDFIFPMFAAKSLNQTDSKSDSKVSALWTACFKELYESFLCLGEVMNQSLTSHCHKKGSSQGMAETPAVSGLAQIFHAGWEVHGFHSIFDCIVGSTVMQHQAGKAISGWTTKIGDTTVGGQPPLLSDIETQTHLLDAFVEHLFINDANNQ